MEKIFLFLTFSMGGFLLSFSRAIRSPEGGREAGRHTAQFCEVPLRIYQPSIKNSNGRNFSSLFCLCFYLPAVSRAEKFHSLSFLLTWAYLPGRGPGQHMTLFKSIYIKMWGKMFLLISAVGLFGRSRYEAADSSLSLRSKRFLRNN